VPRDSGANIIMIKGLNLASVPNFSCFAHTLQLVIDDGIKSQRAVSDVSARPRKVATHFNNSVPAKPSENSRATWSSYSVVCLRGGKRGTCLAPPPFRCYAHKFSLLLVKNLLSLIPKQTITKYSAFKAPPYRN